MQRFEFSDEKSNKFWQVEQQGCELHIQWGKIGTSGQSQVKAFDTEAKAEAAKAKLVVEKTGKGYVPVGSDRVAQPAATAVVAKRAAKPNAERAAQQGQVVPLSETHRADVNAAVAAGLPAAASADGETQVEALSHPDGVADGATDSGKREAIEAWLAARRAAPSVDRQALAAWRELLAQADSDPALWHSETTAPWRKRLGIDAATATTLAEWREAVYTSTELAALWLQDAEMAQLDAQMQAVLASAWQPLLPGEPERAAQGVQPAALAADAWSLDGARFGQVMPMVPHGPLFYPVTGNTPQAAWDALRARWSIALLPEPDYSHVDYRSDIAHAKACLETPEPPAPGDAGLPLLLCLALSLGEGEQSRDGRGDLRRRSEESEQFPAVGGQLWHLLRQTHTVLQRLQVLVAALQFHTGWTRFNRTTPCLYAQLGSALLHKVKPDNPMLARMHEDLLAASETERNEVLAWLEQADLGQKNWPLLAWLLRDVADVSDLCIARSKSQRPPSGMDINTWLLGALREPAQLAEVALHEQDRIPEVVAQAMLRRLGAAGVPLLAERAKFSYAPQLGALTRINHPDALRPLMLLASQSKEHTAQLKLAMQRWPLAALVAATQIAQTGQGSGPQAAMGLGLVRQLLGEVGPALPLVQPWLSAPAWRWLSHLVNAARPTEEADAAVLANQVPALANPPWLQKRKAKAASPVGELTSPVVADAVQMWPEAERKDLLFSVRQAMEQHRSPEQVAAGLAMWERSHQGPRTKAVTEQWVTWIAEGDAASFTASWLEELAQVRAASRYSWDQVWGYRIALLPQAVGVLFFEGIADQVDMLEPVVLLAHWGEAALPGMAKLAMKRPAEVAEFSHRMGTAALALWAAKLAFANKSPTLRKQGSRWLKAWPRHAAAGLLLPALQGTPAEQEAAGKALRWLHGQGHAEALAEVAAQFSGSDGLAALQQVLDHSPLELFPAKFAKTLPEFWQPDTWSRPQLRSGEHLPLSAMAALGQMLSFARPDGVYAGLEQVRDACTPESLGAFGWDLFSAWLAAGAAAKDNWAFTALGVLGDEVCVQRLRPLMKSWPDEGASARASTGLQVLVELGTTSALRLVADVAGRDKPKALVARAQELLTEVAEARGMTLEDLQDRLVPTMGLDERGQIVLDYGPRQFLLTLDENLKPFLRKLENGKPGARLKSQPAKNAADDPALATQAIERFKAIKTQADSVARVQLKRFEQAMVAGRRWTRDEFELLYVNQPLMRQLASRVIWGVYETVTGEEAAATRAASLRDRPERLHQLVRLSPEGELTTADDEPWDWPEGAAGEANEADEASDEAGARWHIGIAHPLEMAEADAAAFAQLLADYELMQPIEQLARPVTRSPQGASQEALRAAREAQVAALTAPGNVSGPRRLLGLKARGWGLSTQDGYMYHGATRELPGDWVAVVEIAPGLSIYEVNQAPPQTIRSLSLHRRGEEGDWGALDAIVYSELMRDMAYLAQV